MQTILPSLLAIALTLVACGSSRTGGDGGAIETIVAEPGHYGTALETQQTAVVNSRAEFAELWRRVYTGHDPVPPLPEVDFERRSVVFATSGVKSTGGYSVEIEALEEIPEGMRLIITATSPGESCMTTQALTTPIHIVSTPKLPAVTLFDWREKTVECE